MQEQDNKPVKKIQAGGVTAALWRNSLTLKSGQEIETLSATLDRRYKDKSGEWRSSSSFQANDIPKAVLVLIRAYAHMMSRSEDDQGPQVPVEEVV